MLELTTRQVQILYGLLQQTFTKSETISHANNLSQNTVIHELGAINYAFKCSKLPIRIIHQHSKGYTFDRTDPSTPQILDTLQRHCKSYLDLAIHRYFSNHERIPQIIRTLLHHDHDIKSEDLSLKFNISLATLNKDLRIVRRVFDTYHITIQSAPYKGMHLCGKTSAKRSCFLDFCDGYNLKQVGILPQRFIEEFNIDLDLLQDITQRIRLNSKTYHINLTDVGFRRIQHYLLLYETNSFHKDIAHETNVSINNSVYTQFATSLLGGQASKTEILILSQFLICSIELNDLSYDFIQELFPQSQVQSKELLQALHTQIGLNLEGWVECEHYIHAVLFMLHFKEHTGIYHYMTPIQIRTYLRSMISSYSLTHYIYQILYPLTNQSLRFEHTFYELALTLYGLFYSLNNKYQKTRFGIFGGVGAYSHEILVRRMLNSLPFELDIVTCYEYQLDEIDPSDFDALIFSEMLNIDTSKIGIPTFFEKNEETPDIMWSSIISKKRIVKILRPYLDDVIETTIDIENANLEESIIQTFIDHNIHLTCSHACFKALIHALIYDGLYDKRSEIKIINLFSKQDLAHRYYVFNLVTPIKKEHGKLAMLHFLFTDTNNGPIIIKNGDSELRRYFNI